MEYSILIIDDDRDLHGIIADMLEGYGYKVTSAFDAEEAFDLLSKNTFHLILLDINLPDSDGFALCKELRRVSTVPVIFASARTAENDRISGYEIGGDDYLPKPYSMKELLVHVQALLRRTYGFDEKRCAREPFASRIRPSRVSLRTQESGHAERKDPDLGMGRVYDFRGLDADGAYPLASGETGRRSGRSEIYKDCV